MKSDIKNIKQSELQDSTTMGFLARGAEIVINPDCKPEHDPRWIVRLKDGLIVKHYADKDVRWLELNGFIKEKRRRCAVRREAHWVAANDLIRAIRNWPGQEGMCIAKDGYGNLRLEHQPQ